MNKDTSEQLWPLLGLMFRSHPWHGVRIGPEAPQVVTAYIEIVPTDTVKYELDKETGHLKIDRPQKYSNVSPTLYGLVPQTYCGERVAEFCMDKSGKPGIVGDGDPLDICVITEKDISRGDCLMQARPIGGLRMLDGNEADDKIIAIMKNDASYGDWNDISELPRALIERLRHYFLTYKTEPGAATSECEITHIYGREEAYEVIRRSQADYHARYSQLEETLLTQLQGRF